MSAEDNVFWSEAIYGAATRQPLVKLSFQGRSSTVTSDDARKIAGEILDVAHAADADAFLVDFLHEELKLAMPEAVRMLAVFRDWRVKRSER